MCKNAIVYLIDPQEPETKLSRLLKLNPQIPEPELLGHMVFSSTCLYCSTLSSDWLSLPTHISPP